jgi:tRNA threonylcarbamoyladenosine biosynthesis protein TsaE
LGAGKTTMAKGIAKGLGVAEELTSPTFTIVSEYEGRLRLHHIDAYRLSGPEDLASAGALELLDDSGAICLVEWSEKVAEALPGDAVIIELLVSEEGARVARLSGEVIEGILA